MIRRYLGVVLLVFVLTACGGNDDEVRILTEERAALQEQVVTLQTQGAALSTERDTLRTEAETLRGEVSRLESELATVLDERDTLQSRFENSLEAQLYYVESRLDATLAEVEALENQRGRLAARVGRTEGEPSGDAATGFLLQRSLGSLQEAALGGAVRPQERIRGGALIVEVSPEEAQVQITGPDSGDGASEATSITLTGSGTLSGLAEGTYTVVAASAGYGSAEEEVYVGAGETKSVNLVLAPLE